MKQFMMIAALALAAQAQAQSPLQTPAPQTGQPVKTKVVMQVSDSDSGKWTLALANARNLQKSLGPANVDIEIVAYGPGIGMVKADSSAAANVREAVASGMAINACENTMAAQHLSKAEMNPAAGYVPSGVVEIVTRQQNGYAYLRP
jgi:intracellular sulfur oxidation DsrE/DsrF family protein